MLLFLVKKMNKIKLVAEEFYPDEAWLNEYAWMYIVGAVLILFAVLGCCYCLCTMGEKPTPGKLDLSLGQN